MLGLPAITLWRRLFFWGLWVLCCTICIVFVWGNMQINSCQINEHALLQEQDVDILQHPRKTRNDYCCCRFACCNNDYFCRQGSIESWSFIYCSILNRRYILLNRKTSPTNSYYIISFHCIVIALTVTHWIHSKVAIDNDYVNSGRCMSYWMEANLRLSHAVVHAIEKVFRCENASCVSSTNESFSQNKVSYLVGTLWIGGASRCRQTIVRSASLRQNGFATTCSVKDTIYSGLILYIK